MNEYEKQIFREYEEENRQHFEENRNKYKKLIRRKDENNRNIRPRGKSNNNY